MKLRRRRPSPKQPRAVEEARREYAELLRHFFAGRMTNDEYERRCDAIVWSSDAPDEVADIYDAAWHLYCDLRTHKMTGDRRPTPELRRRIARWIAFLYSDAPYEPRPTAPPQRATARVVGWICLTWWMTLTAAWIVGPILLIFGRSGAGGSVMLCSAAMFAAAYIYMVVTGRGVSLNPAIAGRAFSDDESDPWPFATAADMNLAIARPRLLAGQQC